MNQLECVISYFFQVYLMLHACVGKLDVLSTVQKSLELNAALVATSVCQCHSQLLVAT